MELRLSNVQATHVGKSLNLKLPRNHALLNPVQYFTHIKY